MNKSVFTLLLFVVLGNCLYGQTRSFGEFNMIPNTSSGKSSSKKGVKTGPAYEKAVNVYNRLVEARGDFRYPVPEFFITTDTNTVANIKYGDPVQIFFSEKAFNVCEEFGAQSESAMAFLLGHELTHFYEKHAWRSNFADDNRNLKRSKELASLFKDLDESIENTKLNQKLLRFDTLIHQFEDAAMEAQCDYLGGFLAYSAGYADFDTGHVLIRTLYRAFKLEDEAPGYVTLTEREDLGRQSAERMKDLIDVFDMANLLVAIGEYEQAYQFYRTLLIEYQSREVYNNVGTTAILQALKMFSANELKYQYPIQLELQMAYGRGDEVVERNKILLQAIQHFEAAISLDPKYAPAYVNKACALALMGDTMRARFYADVEARKVATGTYAKAVNEIEILLGILDASSETKAGKAKAKARFSAIASKERGGMAAYNLAKLDNTAPPEIPSPPTAPTDAGEEMIDGIQPFGQRPTASKKIIRIASSLDFIRDTEKAPNAQIFRAGKIIMLITNPTYAAKTARGIGIGASRADIEKAYGVAPKSIRTINGEILAYDNTRAIIFILEGSDPQEQKLSRWVLYKS